MERVGEETCYIVDGGLLSNYPVHLFDEEGAPSWPTFGFSLREPEETRLIRSEVRGPISLGLAVVDTMSSAIDRQYIEETQWDRTIPIKTPPGVSATSFDLTPETRRELYEAGYAGAKGFFEDWWDWDKHVRARATGTVMERV